MSVPADQAAEDKRIIAFLVKESTASIDEITRLYEHERSGVEASARIKRFVLIITIRKVRAALRQGRVKAGDPNPRVGAARKFTTSARTKTSLANV